VQGGGSCPSAAGNCCFATRENISIAASPRYFKQSANSLQFVHKIDLGIMSFSLRKYHIFQQQRFLMCEIQEKLWATDIGSIAFRREGRCSPGDR
jgi:hypothetical protein